MQRNRTEYPLMGKKEKKIGNKGDQKVQSWGYNVQILTIVGHLGGSVG